MRVFIGLGMNRIMIAWIAVVTVIFQTGCVGTEKRASLVYGCSTFSAGDSVVIEFGDTHTTVWRQTVREDGTIALPFNKSVRIVDKTKSQLEKAIHDIYVPTVMKRLTVRVKGAIQLFYVAGEVKNSGPERASGRYHCDGGDQCGRKLY